MSGVRTGALARALTGALAGALALAVGCTAWWARRSLVLVTVEGPSMEPTLRTGDQVLVRRAALRSVRAGDVVVLGPGAPPAIGFAGGHRWIVKRAVAVPGDPVPRELDALADVPEPAVPAGRLVLLGDGPVSADSRAYGYFGAELLLGVVVRRLPGR
jgi:signal peptidase I